MPSNGLDQRRELVFEPAAGRFDWGASIINIVNLYL